MFHALLGFTTNKTVTANDTEPVAQTKVNLIQVHLLRQVTPKCHFTIAAMSPVT